MLAWFKHGRGKGCAKIRISVHTETSEGLQIGSEVACRSSALCGPHTQDDGVGRGERKSPLHDCMFQILVFIAFQSVFFQPFCWIKRITPQTEKLHLALSLDFLPIHARKPQKREVQFRFCLTKNQLFFCHLQYLLLKRIRFQSSVCRNF